MRAIVLASTAFVLATPAFAQVSVPATVAVTEGQAAGVQITRPTGVPKGKTLGFTYRTVSDTATAGVDFTARSGSQSIRKNANSYTLSVQTVDDTSFELDERLYVEVVAGGVTQRVPIVLRDNDPPPAPDPTPEPMPMPEPPQSGDVFSPSLAGLPAIASPFDPKLGMEVRPVQTRLYNAGLGKDAKGWDIPGADGAFRFTAGGDGPLLYADSVAFHGVKNGSHLHLFFCGLNLNENSTYASIRANPTSNCSDPKYPLNPSGYWLPAFLLGNEVVRPEYVTVYYKQCSSLPNSNCAPDNPQRYGIRVPFPNGIVLITGWDPQKPNGIDGIANNDDDSPGSTFYCSPGDGKHYGNLDDVFANGGCQVGGLLVWNIIFPSCWDGKRLDTANHRDHVTRTSYGSWGYPRCPADHPLLIPTVEFKPTFTVTADMMAVENGRVVSRLKLSSDAMKPGGKSGTSGHADWQPAWDPVAQSMFDAGCLGKGLDCIVGDFGNGFGMKGAQPSYGFDLLNNREPIPPR